MKTNIKLRVTPEQSKAVQKICFNNKIYWAATGSNFEEDNVRYIFIDIDAMTLAYDSTFFHKHKFEEIDADLFIRTNGTCVEPEETTIEATIEECQFEKYGFEKPDFECEILKEYNDHLVGAVYQNEKYFGTSWNKQGTCLQTKGFGYINMDLTPIKKPWYETCTFPCIIMADYCMPVVVKHYEDGYVYDFRDNKYWVNSWRLLTNTEIEGLKQ